MTVVATPEAVALMQLAKTQASHVDVLLQHPSLLEDTGFYKEIQSAAHSVLDCLMETFNKSGPKQFRKNFLVVAKTFNADLRSVLVDCLGKSNHDIKAAEGLIQANRELEKGLALFLKQMQGDRKVHEQNANTVAPQKIKHNT